MKKFLAYMKNEKGVETLEWILIGALITGVAIVVYPGTLQTALDTTVTGVGAAIQSYIPAAS